MPMPDDMPAEMMAMMGAMMGISWLMPLVAIVEIIGAILLMVPKARALGAIVLFPIVIGILLTHITAAPSGLPIALIFLAIDGWVIFEEREKYLPMIS